MIIMLLPSVRVKPSKQNKTEQNRTQPSRRDSLGHSFHCIQCSLVWLVFGYIHFSFHLPLLCPKSSTWHGPIFGLVRCASKSLFRLKYFKYSLDHRASLFNRFASIILNFIFRMSAWMRGNTINFKYVNEERNDSKRIRFVQRFCTDNGHIDAVLPPHRHRRKQFSLYR